MDTALCEHDHAGEALAQVLLAGEAVYKCEVGGYPVEACDFWVSVRLCLCLYRNQRSRA